jgi:hypothetical protein
VTNVDIEGAISDYAATGAVKRAEIYGTPTRWTDSTGCVWEVVSSDWVLNPDTFEGQSIKLVFAYGGWAPYWLNGFQAGQTKGDLGSTNLSWSASEAAEALIATRRTAIPYTNYVGRLALTNDVADARREAKEYTDALETQLAIGNKTVMGAQNANSAYDSRRLYDDGASVSYTASDIIRVSTDAARQMTNGLPEAIGRKQDELPYPTNAIPYAAISGAPSGGGQAWRVEAQACGAFGFVTNGMSIVTFADYDPLQLANGALPENSGWPDGAAMFSRWLIASEGVSGYWPASYMRLVGYGTWPTNDCQCVLWRSGTNIYVNVIMEER